MPASQKDSRSKAICRRENSKANKKISKCSNSLGMKEAQIKTIAKIRKHIRRLRPTQIRPLNNAKC